MTELYQCPCCDYFTLTLKGEYDICPICFWEDNGMDIDTPDKRSGPNHGLTLRQARNNFKELGACESSMLKNVLPVIKRAKYKYVERKI